MSLRRKLNFAACTLLAASADVSAQSNDNKWEVDTSYLSYSESDNRVKVSKSLANLTRSDEDKSITVNLVRDTMSGASPTGAIRSSNSTATYTSASGDRGFSVASGSDYSMSTFEETRVQAGLNYEKEHLSGMTMTYGGLVSQESDYDSVGVNLGLARESKNKLTTYNLGVAFTSDSIYRSDTGGTPEPLSNVQSERPYTKGSRSTVDALLGFTRILNKRTLAQFNITFGNSTGYHSDPYKIISAADSQDRILANFYDSRPSSRIRTTLYTKLAHQIRDTNHSVHVSYRFYQDDWGIQSHTGDFRYRYQISGRQYVEPHVRLYTQTNADFYQRKLNVDAGLNPIIPRSGFASADYRLDKLLSTTLGLNYGVALSLNTKLRLRAEHLKQRFATSDYARLSSYIFQASLRFRF